MRVVVAVPVLVVLALLAGGCFMAEAPATQVVQAPPPSAIASAPAPTYVPPGAVGPEVSATVHVQAPNPPPPAVVVRMPEPPPPPPSPTIVVQPPSRPPPPAPTSAVVTVTTTQTTQTTQGTTVVGSAAIAPAPPTIVGGVTVHGVVQEGTGASVVGTVAAPVVSGPPSPTIVGGAAAPSPLLLVNRTVSTICYLYLRPAGQATWGNDLLGGQMMPPGSQLSVMIPTGYRAWDLLATGCNGATVVEERGQAVPSDRVWLLRSATPAVVATPPVPTGTTVVVPIVTGPSPSTTGGALPLATADFRGRGALTALAVAYWLGADPEDLDELRRAAIDEGACGFIDHDDLDQMCSIAIEDMGACSFLDNDDLETLCKVGFEGESSCGFIRDPNLQAFCRTAFEGERLCGVITDARIQQICWML